MLDTPDTRGCPWEQPPLLLLSGLTDAELDDLLAQLRGAKAVWPYKAVVTPYNPQLELGKAVPGAGTGAPGGDRGRK